MTDSIRDRLARGELVLALGVGRVLHHNLLQIVGIQGGFHAVWFDVEHVGLTTEQIEVGTLACRSQNLDTIVRIPPTDYALVTRCLEAGAGGVMFAQVHSAEHAEQLVRWAKFHPRGQRGLNTGGWDAQFTLVPPAEFCRTANRDSLVAMQIETAGALDECEGIAALDGVDVLFVGPADLSQSLGITGEFFHEKSLEALDRVAAACRKHGKHWGAVSVSPDHAELLIEKGCRILSPASDVKLLINGIEAVKTQYMAYFE